MDLMHIAGLVVGIAGVSPPFLAFGFDAWERLKAVYVPQEDVDQLAADCIAEHGSRVWQFIEDQLDRAHRRGETGEYWLLIRVKEALEAMEANGGAAPP